MRAIFSIVIVLAFSVSAASAEATPTPLSRWITQLQTLAAKRPIPKTKAETLVTRKALIKDLADEHGNTLIRISSRVADVNWRDGVAEIRIEPELPKKADKSPRRPLRLTRSLPFSIKLPEERIGEVTPGMSFIMTARVIFHPERWGGVGRATQSQQLYQVSHPHLPTTPLGTFTTTEYKIEIGGETFPGVWAATTP